VTTAIPWAHGARGLEVAADVARREQRARDIQAEQVEQWAGVATNEDDISKLAAIIEGLVDVNPRVTLSPEQSAELHAMAGEHSVFVDGVTAPAP
jgi:hypothetical protein